MDDEMNMGVAVKDLFLLPHFQDAVLLGGGGPGLDKMISRVNVMEVPDVVDWVRPGEFLMTTGYPFRHNPEVLVTLIAELSQKGVVALGVKTKRFLDEVPQAAIEAAQHYNLPLIELPPNTIFSDVVREVMERVLVAEFKDLTILQGRVQRLSHVLLHGDGLPAFLKHLELMIQSPIVLLEPENTWLSSPEAEELCALVDEQEWRRIREEQMLESNVIRAGEENIRVQLLAVTEEQPEPYLLIIFDRNNVYGTVNSLTVNWAGRLLGFEISNMQARRTIETKYADQYLQDWLAGRIVSAMDLRLRAEACGWILEDHARYRAGVIHFHEQKPEVKELQELTKRLNWESASRKCDYRWTVLEGEIAVLLISHLEEKTSTILEAAHVLLRKVMPGQSITLCLGREVAKQEDVSGSYLDASRVREIRAACRLMDQTLKYEDMGVYLLLYRLQGTEELDEFRRLYLQPLLEMDRKQQGDLLTTLRVYFQSNCNAKETAERMFVHYNTINYRLERIKTELGMRLDDPEIKLILQVAIKLGELRELA